MPVNGEDPINSTASSRVLATMLETAFDLAKTTKTPYLSTNNASSTTDKAPTDQKGINGGFLIHVIGGWVLTSIFVFGILFLVVTHFLGRREWRKYQERLEEERSAVNHVIVDPKFMKYTKKGWREIALSL